MGQKTKFADLRVDGWVKQTLAIMVKRPRTVAEIAALTDRSYDNMSKHLQVWEAKGWITRTKTLSGKTLWELDTARIEL